jgi:integrase
MNRTPASGIPLPTKEHPHAQVKWIFEQKALAYPKEQTKDQLEAKARVYSKYLEDTNDYKQKLQEDPRFFIRVEWDQLALIRFRAWLEKCRDPSHPHHKASKTLSGYFYDVRKVMGFAYESGVINVPVSKPPTLPTERETKSREPYSDDELELLLGAIDPLVEEALELTKPYVRTGKGSDPRLWGQGIPESGYGHFENMVWYFENVLDCEPVDWTEYRKHGDKTHLTFLASSKRYGGLRKLYRAMGVPKMISVHIVVPCVVKLAFLTGLNVRSLLDLHRDCLRIEHPITGLPCVRYYKERSGGNEDLHLSLFDKTSDNGGDPDDTKASSEIIRLIEGVEQATARLVENASDEEKEYLFLVQSKRRSEWGQVRHLTNVMVEMWMNDLVERQDLRDEKENPLSFTLARFRPTKITNMVRADYPVEKIQAAANHKYVDTTARYISTRAVQPEFRTTISDALAKIRENASDHAEQPLPESQSEKDQPGEFVFEAAFCKCKNPYDPPEEVKEGPHYSEGDACTYYNQCLFCDNVVITKNSLPKIIAFRRQIQVALDRGTGFIPKEGELYRRLASLIDDLLREDDPFSEEEIEWATELAEMETEEVLDGFIYQGVQ